MILFVAWCLFTVSVNSVAGVCNQSRADECIHGYKNLTNVPDLGECRFWATDGAASGLKWINECYKYFTADCAGSDKTQADAKFLEVTRTVTSRNVRCYSECARGLRGCLNTLISTDICHNGNFNNNGKTLEGCVYTWLPLCHDEQGAIIKEGLTLLKTGCEEKACDDQQAKIKTLRQAIGEVLRTSSKAYNNSVQVPAGTRTITPDICQPLRTGVAEVRSLAGTCTTLRAHALLLAFAEVQIYADVCKVPAGHMTFTSPSSETRWNLPISVYHFTVIMICSGIILILAIGGAIFCTMHYVHQKKKEKGQMEIPRDRDMHENEPYKGESVHNPQISPYKFDPKARPTWIDFMPMRK